MFRPGFRAFESAFTSSTKNYLRYARFRPVYRPVYRHAQFRSYRRDPFDDELDNILRRWVLRVKEYINGNVIFTFCAILTVEWWYDRCDHREEVPISGRSQVVYISPAVEARIGALMAREIEAQYARQILDDAHPTTRLVKKVLGRIIPFATAAGLQDVDWEVKVIDNPEENAFVVPGGKVFVFTGILPLCRDEDGLAAVLGHEIAHVLARHAAENHDQFGFHSIANRIQELFGSLTTCSENHGQFGFHKIANRIQEDEADQIGLELMAQACYRPEAAVEFWARLEQRARAKSPPQFFSTHTSQSRHVVKVREWLPKAHAQAELARCHVTAGWARDFNRFRGQNDRGQNEDIW